MAFPGAHVDWFLGLKVWGSPRHPSFLSPACPGGVCIFWPEGSQLLASGHMTCAAGCVSPTGQVSPAVTATPCSGSGSWG